MSRDLIARTGIGQPGALLFGLVWPAGTVLWARRQRVPVWGWAGAIGVGLSMAGAWWFTCAVAKASFDPHPVQALSFTGSAAELLTRVLFPGDKPPHFDLGLVPGVFIGAFIAAALFRELNLEGFPRLAGQHAGHVARQLADCRSAKRVSTTMQPMVSDLTPVDFNALGKYFETRPPQKHKVDDTELAQMGRFIYSRGNPYSGVPACSGCHGPQGHGTAPLPRLAGSLLFNPSASRVSLI